MDIASLIGIILCFGMILFGIISGAGVGALPRFVDPGSLLITLGGSFFAVMAQYTIPEFIRA